MYTGVDFATNYLLPDNFGLFPLQQSGKLSHIALPPEI